MTDRYVSVPVAASVQIAEMRDTAMRNIEISTMKYSSDWAEVAQLLDWLCGEIDSAPEPESSVPMPKNADQSELMVKAGMMWLEANAPERLKPASADPWKEAVINECMISECCLVESNPVQTVKNLMLHAQDCGAASAEPAQQWIKCSERMPWSRLLNAGWMIVGMNHYRMGGGRHLFCSMARDGACIVAEGKDEAEVFSRLESEAGLTKPQPPEVE